MIVITHFDDKKEYSLSTLLARIEEGTLDIPDNNQDNWDDETCSQLIDSMLLRLDIGTIYFDMADNKNWKIINGYQRMRAIKKFVIDKDFALSNMGMFDTLNGKTFDDLDPHLQRKIRETVIMTTSILDGTTAKQKEILVSKLIDKRK